MKLHLQCKFLGVEVWSSSEPALFAHTRGIWPWTKIVVGRAWECLPREEQIAVLLHELHHVRMFHVEQRLLLLPLLWLPWIRRWAGRQEFACDAHAARNGYGVEMIRVLRRMYQTQAVPEWFQWYPHPGERIQRLLLEIDRCNHAT